MSKHSMVSPESSLNKNQSLSPGFLVLACIEKAKSKWAERQRCSQEAIRLQHKRKKKWKKFDKAPKRACVNILCLQQPASFQSSCWKLKKKCKETQQCFWGAEQKQEKSRVQTVKVRVQYRVVATYWRAGEHTISQSIPPAALPHPRTCTTRQEKLCCRLIMASVTFSGPVYSCSTGGLN